MSNHTPGPWTVDEHNEIRHSKDGKVASVHYSGTVPFTWEQMTGSDRTEYKTWSTKTNEANARLIAAAPDLYEACQAAFVLLSEYAPIWAVKVEDQLREALAKAELRAISLCTRQLLKGNWRAWRFLLTRWASGITRLHCRQCGKWKGFNLHPNCYSCQWENIRKALFQYERGE